MTVLYHPTPEVVANIRSWAGQVDAIFVVDNSGGDIPAVVSAIAALGKVVLTRNRENEGIARALNIGAEKAGEEGYDILLTMDQDSSAAPDMVEKMLTCLGERDSARVGIISPFHMTKSSGNPPSGVACQDVMTPMTSGCLLSLDAYREVGPFRDDLFIDFVDNEYCLRLRKQRFLVLRANDALLQHSVGDTHKYGPFIATNHSPLRRYYKTRNRFLVNRLYRRDFPGHCLFDRVRLAKEIASIILFEGEKLAKLRMMWRGYRDYRRGKFGKYEE
ncbi:glycosyltransferase family 2 protein [Geobacter sp. AOG1]|uniref:glycosyltransferase family 2 protein n=1 Tax=Geobacter sp. AOG1 TaxID=1566346 RepID=UPI001CC538EF|nr:glycosyltransferase family 2 protein [Geobacter sp. AOG1]